MPELPYCRVTNTKNDKNYSKILGSQKASLNKNNILTLQNVQTDKELSYYFGFDFEEKNDSVKLDKNIPIELIFEKLPDDSIYQTSGKEIKEPCTIIDNLDLPIWLIMLIPGLYILTSLCLIFVYCRYVKIRDDYERLREVRDDHGENYNERGNQLELSVQD